MIVALKRMYLQMKSDLILRLKAAAEKDPTIVCPREKSGETLGSNPDYLLEIHKITKSDLIRLERKGLALKARYEVTHKHKRYISVEALKKGVSVTGTHRTRWIIFTEAFDHVSV